MPPPRPTRLTRQAAARAAAKPSTREIPSDPIRHPSPDHPLMPQSQIQSIDDAPNADLDFRPHNRIFPLDDDGDEVLDDHRHHLLDHEVYHVRPRSRKRLLPKMPSSVTNRFAGVDSLLATRTQALAKEDPPTPVVKRRRTRSTAAVHTHYKDHSDDDPRLQHLIRRCKTDDEIADLKAAWATPAGRRKVQALHASSSDDDENPSRKRRTARRRLRSRPQTRTQTKSRSTSRSKDDPILVSDDQHDAGDDSTDEALNVRRSKTHNNTRQGKARILRQATVKSVPLPKKNGVLAERLNSRGAVPTIVRTGGRITRASAAAKKAAKARDRAINVGTRRSSRNRRRLRSAANSSDDSDQELDVEVEEPEAAESDYSDEVLDEEISIVEEEIEEDEEEDVSDDEDFEDPEPVRKSKRRKGAKKNNRRKRTRPKNVFESNAEELSAREQRERLDFLVKQSAEIARDLHTAMAEAANDRPSSGSKSPSRETAGQTTEGQLGADGSAAEPSQRPGDSGAPVAEEKFAPPNANGKELQAHQTDGVKWLLTLDAQGLNAILADEMGLGKTIQAVAFLASLVLSGKRGPHLVIAPKNVCEHWAAEVTAWYPGQINVVTHLGPAESRLEHLQWILEEDNFDILVTSFEIALRDLFTHKRPEGVTSQYIRVLRAFRKVEFEYLVVDEAHRLKNDRSRLNVGIRNYRCAQRRLLLTGTPLSNDLKELWCLMNVLNPRIFSSKATFEAWFSAPFESGKGSKKGIMTHAEQSVIVDRLHTIIRPFFRRRVRADVCPSFTSADETVIRCPMSELQRALMLHFRRRADDRDASKNNILMCMRAVSSHPFISSNALFDGEVSQVSAKLVASCGKFVFLHYSLPRLLAGGHRVLIFSQFRRALDFLEDLMDLLGIAYGRLDGLTTAEDRLSGLAKFNAPRSKLQVFLLSTRAGGIGINLQTADTVILFDSDWNPSADLQAVSRIQRIGQKKTVHIMRLVTEKAVDSIILETARRKLRTQAVAVGAGKFNTSSGAALDQKMRQKDLERLLEELDVKTFLPTPDVNEQAPVPSSQSSPESMSPNRQQRSAQAMYFKEWAQQLLRPGETALPDVDQPAIWIDSQEDSDGPGFPTWLGKDANLIAAGKALDCAHRATADRVYEETIQSIARVGAFSKKDRASRARRNVVVDLGSDLGSDTDDNENISEGDPSISVEECSDISTDEEFVPDAEIDLLSATKPGNQIMGLPSQVGGSEKTPSKPVAPQDMITPFNIVSPFGSGGPQLSAGAVSQSYGNGKSQQNPPKPPSGFFLQNGVGANQQGRPDVEPESATKLSSSANVSGYVDLSSVPMKPPPANTVSRANSQPGLSVCKAPGAEEFYVGYVPDQASRARAKGDKAAKPNALQPSPGMQPILPSISLQDTIPSVPQAQSRWSVSAQKPGLPSTGQPRLSDSIRAISAGLPNQGVSPATPQKGSWAGSAHFGNMAPKSTQPASDRLFSGRPQEALHMSDLGFSVVGSAVSPGLSHAGRDQTQEKRPSAATQPAATLQRTRSALKARTEPGRSQGLESADAELLGSVDDALSRQSIYKAGQLSRSAEELKGVSGLRGSTHKQKFAVGDAVSQQTARMTSQLSSSHVDAGRRYRVQPHSINNRAGASYRTAPQAEKVHPASDSRIHVPTAAKSAHPRPTARASVAPRVAPMQENESDQGSPLYCRNPRTLNNRPSASSGAVCRNQKQNSAPLGTVAETNGIYSGSDMQKFVNSLGNSTSVEYAKAACFTALVDRLQEATKVTDIDFLVDALLACRCNIDDAADYIYNRIS